MHLVTVCILAFRLVLTSGDSCNDGFTKCADRLDFANLACEDFNQLVRCVKSIDCGLTDAHKKNFVDVMQAQFTVRGLTCEGNVSAATSPRVPSSPVLNEATTEAGSCSVAIDTCLQRFMSNMAGAATAALVCQQFDTMINCASQSTCPVEVKTSFRTRAVEHLANSGLQCSVNESRAGTQKNMAATSTTDSGRNLAKKTLPDRVTILTFLVLVPRVLGRSIRYSGF